MEELFLEKVHKAIESNLANENFGVEELALEIGISRTHLHRKLKDLTGQSASQILKEFRLKKAMEMLQNNVGTSSEISYQVGFGSPSYFTTCFREYFGYPPGKVKRKKSLKKSRRPAISRKYLFGTLAILVVLALIVLNIIPRISGKEELSNSIAVLPFTNDSPGNETSFINGTMEEILNNLSKIEDLRVPARISVEKYRNSPKQISDIAKELNVSYVLVGSGQRAGNKIRLTVQLLEGRSEKQIWSESYVKEVEDVIGLQSEIAQQIAKEINVVITPAEKQLIEKISTSNVQALDYYRKGREEFLQYWIDNENREALRNAEVLYNLALEADSTFAQVYVGLAQVYSYKDYWATYWTEEFLDSAQRLADKALSFDSQLSDAYVIRGENYRLKNQPSNAIIEYDKAIKLNPNNWAAYAGKGRMYQMDDYMQCIYNLLTATTLNLGPELPFLFRLLGESFFDAGFQERSQYYYQKALSLDSDSVYAYLCLALIESHKGNYENAVLKLEEGYSMYPDDIILLRALGIDYLYLHQYEKSLLYFKKYLERLEELGGQDLAEMAEIGYVYWQNGYEKEADYYYDEQIYDCLRMNEMGRFYSHLKFSYHDLATVYAARGEKDKAYENLRIFNQRERMPLWAVQNLKYLPLYDGMRSDPEFQQILLDVETKYQAEHERVRQWLEENDW